MQRPFAIAVCLVLGGLVTAGLQTGPTTARGPDRTMSSELVVEGGRKTPSPTRGRKTPRPSRPRANGNNGKGRLAVEVARTAEEVEAIRPVWEAQQGEHLTSDIDHFLTHVGTAPGVVRPHVVLTELDDGPPGLVVCRLEDTRLHTRLGYKTVFSPRVRTLTVVYGGVLGHVDETSAPLVIDAVRRSLAPGEVDLVRVRALEPGSALHTAATERAPALLRERFAQPVVHWRSELPSTLEEFLAPRKKKVRWQARRDATHFAKAYGDEAEIRIYSSPDELDRLFEDSKRVHRTTYQHGLGVGFSGEEPNRSLTRLAMERGWFRGYVLYLRGEPIAFWHGNAYRGVFGLGPTGFDPAYADDRPGGFLLMQLIEDLCADESVRTFDFGFGDATYKRQLGDVCREEQDVVSFSPRPRPLSVNLVRTAVHGATAAGRSLLARQGGLGELKRRWRSRLTSRPTA